MYFKWPQSLTHIASSSIRPEMNANMPNHRVRRRSRSAAAHRQPLARFERRETLRYRRLLVEPLEDRRLLADLILQNVSVVRNDSPLVSTTPVIGERICVRADYRTVSLPAGASYRLEFVVDGVSLFGDFTSSALVPLREIITGIAAGGTLRPGNMRSSCNGRSR